MKKDIFIAYGDNVLIQQLSVNGNTAKGMVIHSNARDLNHGDIILYGYSEWNEISLDDYPDETLDCIWKPKIRCIVKQVEEKESL